MRRQQEEEEREGERERERELEAQRLQAEEAEQQYEEEQPEVEEQPLYDDVPEEDLRPQPEPQVNYIIQILLSSWLFQYTYRKKRKKCRSLKIQRKIHSQYVVNCDSLLQWYNVLLYRVDLLGFVQELSMITKQVRKCVSNIHIKIEYLNYACCVVHVCVWLVLYVTNRLGWNKTWTVDYRLWTRQYKFWFSLNEVKVLLCMVYIPLICAIGKLE